MDEQNILWLRRRASERRKMWKLHQQKWYDKHGLSHHMRRALNGLCNDEPSIAPGAVYLALERRGLAKRMKYGGWEITANGVKLLARVDGQ